MSLHMTCTTRKRHATMKNCLLYLIIFLLFSSTLTACHNDVTEPTFNRSKIVITFDGDIEAMEPYGSLYVTALRTTDLYINDSIISAYDTKVHGITKDSLVLNAVWNASYTNCGINCTMNFTKVVEDNIDEHISCRFKKYTNGILDIDTTLVIKAIKKSELQNLNTPTVPTEWVMKSIQL